MPCRKHECADRAQLGLNSAAGLYKMQKSNAGLQIGNRSISHGAARMRSPDVCVTTGLHMNACMHACCTRALGDINCYTVFSENVLPQGTVKLHNRLQNVFHQN